MRAMEINLHLRSQDVNSRRPFKSRDHHKFRFSLFCSFLEQLLESGAELKDRIISLPVAIFWFILPFNSFPLQLWIIKDFKWLAYAEVDLVGLFYESLYLRVQLKQLIKIFIY